MAKFRFRNSALGVILGELFRDLAKQGMSSRSSASTTPLWGLSHGKVPHLQLHSRGYCHGEVPLPQLCSRGCWNGEVLLLQLRSRGYCHGEVPLLKLRSRGYCHGKVPLPQHHSEENVSTKFRFCIFALGV